MPFPSETTISSQLLAKARLSLIQPVIEPQLSVQNSVLTASDLADEYGSSDLLDQLQADGFQGGVKRELRGNSKTVSGVDSRVLLFDTPQGAQSFVTYMSKHSEPFFGGPAGVKPLKSGSAKGVSIRPPDCGCAGAYPVYAGIVAEGSRVLWLEVTGPRTSVDDLHQLLGTMAS